MYTKPGGSFRVGVLRLAATATLGATHTAFWRLWKHTKRILSGGSLALQKTFEPFIHPTYSTTEATASRRRRVHDICFYLYIYMYILLELLLLLYGALDNFQYFHILGHIHIYIFFCFSLDGLIFFYAYGGRQDKTKQHKRKI